VHLVGFIIRIYHDARPHERQNAPNNSDHCSLVRGGHTNTHTHTRSHLRAGLSDKTSALCCIELRNISGI